MDKNKISDENGVVSFSRGILNNIVSIAAGEVKGVASLYKSKSIGSGVKIEFDSDNCLIVDVFANIFYGYSVPEVAYSIQENVKNSVETMTDYKVQSVNISVLGVTFNSEAN